MGARAVRRLVGAALVLTGGALVLASPGGAADEPVFTFTASAETGVPGDQVTLTFSGCPAGTNPQILRQVISGDAIGVQPVPGTVVGTTVTAVVTLGQADEQYSGWCGTGTLGGGGAYLDVENPLMHLTGDQIPTSGPLGGNLAVVDGTDCPAGGEALVTFERSDGRRFETSATPDEHGDWTVAAPPGPEGFGFTVSATCGDVDYGSLTWTGTGATSTTTSQLPTTTSTTAVAQRGGSAAAPATPVAGSAAYTG
jgi:hypothetical protein